MYLIYVSLLTAICIIATTPEILTINRDKESNPYITSNTTVPPSDGPATSSPTTVAPTTMAPTTMAPTTIKPSILQRREIVIIEVIIVCSIAVIVGWWCCCRTNNWLANQLHRLRSRCEFRHESISMGESYLALSEEDASDNDDMIGYQRRRLLNSLVRVNDETIKPMA